MNAALDDLLLLVTIADQGSFTAAARQLSLPKSTLSRRLSAYEAQLGTTLFHRSTRALALTEDGARFYALAKPVIDAARDVADQLLENQTEPAGRVTLTTTAALGQYLVAPQLCPLLDAHRQLRVELRLTERRVNMVSDGIDLAIRMGDLEDSDLVARTLGIIGRSVVASPAYLARAGTPHHPSELADYNGIVTSNALQQWHFADGWDAEINWQVAAGNMMVAKDLALAGHGLAILPDFMTQQELATGTLVRIMPDHPLRPSPAWIVATRQRHRSLAVRTVMEHLVRTISQPGPV
jgi:DNA-binding transcriptional LysR family regulator